MALTETQGSTLIQETDHRETKLKSMESLLDAAGTNGWRNYLLFFCCSWGTFVGPLHVLSYQFLGATPDYWCNVPELVAANWTQSQIKILTVPKRLWNDTSVCEMLDYNYTLAAERGFESSLLYLEGERDDSKTIFCETRQFDENEPITTVSKWDLVCGRRAIYSTTQSTVYMGILVGSLASGYLSDRVGRRKVLVWMAPLYLLIGIATAFSTTVTMYIVLKFVIAFIGMSVYLPGLVLALEMCSTSQRSCVGALFAFPWALAYMVVPGIAYYVRSFSYLQIAVTLPALTIFPAFWLIPESPRWLVLQGRYEEAIEILSNIAKSNKRDLPPTKEMLDLMVRIVKQEKRKPLERRSPCSQICYKLFGLWVAKGWRWRLPVLFFCWFSVSLVYFGVSLNPPDLRTGKYMYIFLGGLLEVPAYALVWPAAHFLGRRKSMVILYFICATAILGAMGVRYFNTEEETSNPNSSSKISYLLALSLFGKLAITSAFELIWMYTIELLPTEFRSVVVGEGSVFARIGSIFSPYIVDLLKQITEWGPDAIFGSFSVVAGFLFMFLPETKDTNLPEFTADEENEDSELDVV